MCRTARPIAFLSAACCLGALLLSACQSKAGNTTAPTPVNHGVTPPRSGSTIATDEPANARDAPNMGAYMDAMIRMGPMESRYIRDPRRLTKPAWHARAGEAYFSPDGSRIAYQATPLDYPQYVIYTLELDTPDATPNRVSPQVGDTTCAWIPSDDRVLFASTHADPLAAQKTEWEMDHYRLLKPYYMGQVHRRPVPYAWNFDPYMDIYSRPAEGAELERLTEAPGYDAEGSISPDGTTLVFCSERSGDLEIWTKHLESGELRRISFSAGYDGGPFFSPDGTKIIWRADPGAQDGNFQLFIADLTKADPKHADRVHVTQLTDRPWMHWCPFWHPDGKRLIYTSTRDGHFNYELWLLDLETMTETRLTYTFGFDGLPVFSPDGSKIMWTSRRENGSHLWIADFVDPKTLEPAEGELDRDLAIADR